MKYCVVSLAVVVASVLSATADDSELNHHYGKLSALIKSNADPLQSAMLTQVSAHVSFKNPMQTIYDTCMSIRKDVVAERKAAVQHEQSDRKVCSTNIGKYSQNKVDYQNKANQQAHLASVNNKKILKKYTAGILVQLNSTRKAMRGAIVGKETKVARGQKNRNEKHEEYLKLAQAFHWALGNITTISRFLNGQGSLGDLHGQASLLELNPSEHMTRLADNLKHVPQLSSMLQVFSKSFQKVEKVAKIGATSANTQSSNKDMDAINTILIKVRENLNKALKAATEAENAQIGMWKTSKRSQRSSINVDWKSHWQNYQNQGEEEIQIGKWWESEGKHFMHQSTNQKQADYNTILLEFLHSRCKDSRVSFGLDMSSKANELNALDSVIRYLEVNVLGKNGNKGWSKNITDVVSMPYTWKVTPPQYVSVSNSFSTVAYPGPNSPACREGYSTIFSKVRVLQESSTPSWFLDPNDLTHSTNWNVDRTANKTSVTCQLFPTGIPVARAHSCSDKNYAKASIDLTGTPFTFGKAALRMFQPLGRKTEGSIATLEKAGKVLNLKIRGRCGDLYGDDAGAVDADYRSDPIPLNGVKSISGVTPPATPPKTTPKAVTKPTTVAQPPAKPPAKPPATGAKPAGLLDTSKMDTSKKEEEETEETEEQQQEDEGEEDKEEKEER